jgi:hypothetical protein
MGSSLPESVDILDRISRDRERTALAPDEDIKELSNGNQEQDIH